MQIRTLHNRLSKALVLENPHSTLDQELESFGIEVERLPESATRDVDLVCRRLQEGGHDLLFKRSRFPVDERVLEASPHLAAVMLCCIGDDSVDKLACARHGVMVMNDPISNGRSVAEMVIGEMICLARRIFIAHEAGREHLWTKESSGRFEVAGKHIAVVGLGNIGRQVAQLAASLGMRVLFYDQSDVAREVGSALGWTSCGSIDEAFRKADVVTLHLSAEDSDGKKNVRLITAEHFAQLAAECDKKSPRVFINAARDFLYDPEDLKQALADGTIRAAAVDVFPDEPGSREDGWHNPYADTNLITTTPHIGAATEDAQPRIAVHMAMSAHMLDKRGAVRDTVFRPKLQISLDTRPPYWALSVIHSDRRGTKKAISDAIFESGANNIDSSHRDLPRYGIAYDISAIDKPLSDEELQHMIRKACEISDDPHAVRSVRQFHVDEHHL